MDLKEEVQARYKKLANCSDGDIVWKDGIFHPDWILHLGIQARSIEQVPILRGIDWRMKSTKKNQFYEIYLFESF